MCKENFFPGWEILYFMKIGINLNLKPYVISGCLYILFSQTSTS